MSIPSSLLFSSHVLALAVVLSLHSPRHLKWHHLQGVMTHVWVHTYVSSVAAIGFGSCSSKSKKNIFRDIKGADRNGSSVWSRFFLEKVKPKRFLTAWFSSAAFSGAMRKKIQVFPMPLRFSLKLVASQKQRMQNLYSVLIRNATDVALLPPEEDCGRR